MNFFGHAYVAARRTGSAGLILGAMLPDFGSMLGVRWGTVANSSVREGVALHHRTDAVFHATPTFVRLNRDARRSLEASGVERGPAMALAHVGLELVLDGLLARNSDELTSYRDALRVDVGAQIGWDRPRDAEAYEDLRRRLVASPLPQGYLDPDFTAERLYRILGRRPRLTPGPRARAIVVPWLERLRSDERWAHELIEETLARV